MIPKQSGAVRICMDLKPLNESVLREAHPIPKVDDTLAQLSGVNIFSKMDTNSGFDKFHLLKSHATSQYFPVRMVLLPFGLLRQPCHASDPTQSATAVTMTVDQPCAAPWCIAHSASYR